MRIHKASIAGVFAVAITVVGVTQLSGAPGPRIAGDFRNAAVAEVKNAHGQILMRGNFAPIDADDEGEVERLAVLASAVAGGVLAGEAEIEYQADSPDQQEIELNATGVTAGTVVTLVIDGTEVATATADKRGRVSVEVKTKGSAVR